MKSYTKIIKHLNINYNYPLFFFFEIKFILPLPFPSQYDLTSFNITNKSKLSLG